MQRYCSCSCRLWRYVSVYLYLYASFHKREKDAGFNITTTNVTDLRYFGRRKLCWLSFSTSPLSPYNAYDTATPLNPEIHTIIIPKMCLNWNWTVEADRISFSLYFSAPENAFFKIFLAFNFLAENDIRILVFFSFFGTKMAVKKKQKRKSVLWLSQCTAGRTLSHLQSHTVAATSPPAVHEYCAAVIIIIQNLYSAIMP